MTDPGIRLAATTVVVVVLEFRGDRVRIRAGTLVPSPLTPTCRLTIFAEVTSIPLVDRPRVDVRALVSLMVLI